MGSDSPQCGRRIYLLGTTQGVGLRPWIHGIAREQGITGRATNTRDGVEIEAWGSPAALDAMLERLRRPMHGAVALESVTWESLAPTLGQPVPTRFRLDARASPGSSAVPLAPDLAVCPACLAEISDPHDRRHRYAFTSCTACGPRFAIARELPWERARTSMRAFSMCDECRREYDTPQDRRHHSEANACPDCGPKLRFESVGGTRAAQPPLEAAVDALRRGAILAVRGIGGYHLVCDASDDSVVLRLRKRKQRPRKPFAVMVADVSAARALAHVDPDEEALLRGPEAPIVLLRRRGDAGIADAVAPELPWIGLLLAYTPLHHLLLAGVGRPLVVTSANPSGEPITWRLEDAPRLSHLVDGFLHHDREISAPCEDSVTRVFAGGPRLLRRSRGWVPRSLALPGGISQPVLGCGAQLASTVCLALGTRAWPSQHLGDLGSPESADAWESAVLCLERWLGVRAEVIGHDLHPDYTSTQLARARHAALHVPVQHHHAHVASAIAEHHLSGPVVGVAFDGTGLGTDGSAWGGEILLADATGFERLAALRPIALVGGDIAVEQVWRLALAAVEDAFDGAPPLEALPVFRALAPERLDAVRSILHSSLRCVPAHGAGRWFDALGALVLDRTDSAHSGDVATHWNAVADPAARDHRPYPFELRTPDRRDGPDVPELEIDLRPLVRAAVRDRIAGRPAPEISGRFHASLAAAVAAVLARLRGAVGDRPVVLTGGCFQNPMLAEGVATALAPDWTVHLHERVPSGDGGLALGQALIAGARARVNG